MFIVLLAYSVYLTKLTSRCFALKAYVMYHEMNSSS